MLQGDGKMVTYADEILDVFVADLIREHPDLLVISGDLTFNGEKESHRALATKLNKLREQGIAVAVLPGNHDIDSVFARSYENDRYYDAESIDAAQFREIYKELGYDQARHSHEESLSYSLPLNDSYTLILLDSVAHELKGSTMDVGGFLSESTWQWLKQELEMIRKEGKQPIVAMHHNLAVHFTMLQDGYTIDEHERLAALFNEYDVKLVLSGHMHCQHIAEIAGIYDIASGSLVDAPLQYGIMELSSDSMDYQTHTLRISADADAYFDQVSRNKFADAYGEIADEEIREQMLDVMVAANRYFFAGTLYEQIDTLKAMPGYAYYEQEEGNVVSFYRDYLASMMQETQNHQKLHLDWKP